MLPLLLAGCSNDADPGPGGVTVGEARALDEAAAMLDSQRLPEETLEAPAADGTAPAPGDTAATEPLAPAPSPN
ncbi:hypothetical protein GRI97_01415 [Altererythrobacter xixiisoli]|uniref:Uncharacterized protein n=2 Tax=Croceibacterium xixiisoli TaxID=1476466 RepID=A0A6I4TNJ4_9SPHN|nr:hypothetical protein [Croceibacterium xixiisoli]